MLAAHLGKERVLGAQHVVDAALVEPLEQARDGRAHVVRRQ